jgi:hypothetical protein
MQSETISPKGVMDGAASLSEAADMLVGAAAMLRAMERAGWQLTGPIKDDHGLIEREAPRLAAGSQR